jgi:hypothetical protein
MPGDKSKMHVDAEGLQVYPRNQLGDGVVKNLYSMVNQVRVDVKNIV